MYICPVCGYNKLEEPARDFNICPSCYTEFGYEDANRTHYELRQRWIRNGMRWAAIGVMPPPPNWNPIEQLIGAGYGGDLAASSAQETRDFMTERTLARIAFLRLGSQIASAAAA